MSGYPEQPWPDHGRFTCTSCGSTFPKASETHGASGMCTQCEIAHGLIKIHGDDAEANAREQRETKSVIAQYKRAFPYGDTKP